MGYGTGKPACTPPCIPLVQPVETVIFANGDVPTHAIPLACLHNARRIIACDGAIAKLEALGFAPHAIVGDLDSISTAHKSRYSSIVQHVPDQMTNDLTKAVLFARQNQWQHLTILGATGEREDHTLANIALLAQYSPGGAVQMVTNHGVFVPIEASARFCSFPKQQVSIFSLQPETRLTFHNLLYPVADAPLRHWWEGTLNEALADNFSIDFTGGSVVVFRVFP